MIPANEDIEPEEQVILQMKGDLKPQIPLTLAAFEPGIGSAADILSRGYGAHDDHDRNQASLFSLLTDSIDFSGQRLKPAF